MTHRTLIRRLVATVTATLVIGALAVPASATYPGANGRIAFTKGGDIVTRTLSNPTLKTLGEGSDPNYSPDGRKIAYMRYTSGSPYGWDIWIMNADGTRKRNVTKNESVYESVTFAPNGSKLLFTQYTGAASGARRLYTINLDGTGKKQFAKGVGGTMEAGKYSPNGARIAYVGGRADRPLVLKTIRADGAAATVKTIAGLGNSRAPDWAPDGKRLVFEVFSIEDNTTNIWRVNADGTKRTRLTDVPEGVYATNAIFSPDGTRLLFDRDGQIWRMKPSGTNQVALDVSSGWNYEPAWQPRP